MEMQLRARRALSMGPTADVDPMTEEFHLQLLDKSTDSAKNTGAQQAPRSTTERALPHVVEPAAERLGKDAIFTENGVDLAALKLHLQREGRLELEAAMEIVKKATFVLGKEPVLLNIKVRAAGRVCACAHVRWPVAVSRCWRYSRPVLRSHCAP